MGCFFWLDVRRVLEPLGAAQAWRGCVLLSEVMRWKRLETDEVYFVGKHAAAICFEVACSWAAPASFWAHDWVVLACALFQTVSYFSDGTMFFRDWERLAGLPRGSQKVLMELMRCRGWRTQSAAAPNPWHQFFGKPTALF